MWQPSWGTLTIAIFHQIFTHWANFFFFCFGGRWGWGGGFFSHLEIISWTSMQDRDYHMSQEITMPLSPPTPLHPSPFRLFAFSSSSTDVRTCALHNIVVMKHLRLLKGGGDTHRYIKLADGCLSCTCLAIFWSARLDDGNIKGLQIVGWCSRGVSIYLSLR
jgi:hypothetical protein